MKILITGGGGFIGSALLTELPKEYETIAIDNGIHFNQLRPLIGNNITLIEGDILDAALLNRIMDGVDIVIHLAAIVGNQSCLQHPSQAVMINVGGTHQILQHAIKHGVSRFIFSSTQAVYTTFTKRKMPLNEEMKPMPDDLYGALKAVSEYEIMDSINYVILRLSNIYGYGSGFGAQWQGVIGRFIKSAADFGEISIYGSGIQGIDFVHIDDLLQLIFTIIEKSTVERDIFNVGNNKVTEIKELAQIIAECFKEDYNRDIILKNVEAPPGKIWPDRWLANEKIKKISSSFPSISLKQGIRQLIKKYMEKKK